jgi:hypothetical protein
LVWIIGDLGVCTFFILRGFAQHQAKFDDLFPSELVASLCLSLASRIVAWKFTASAGGVVNHTYPALLTFGVAWLCAAPLACRWLARAPQIHVVGRVLSWMERRPMSIHL